MLWIYERGLEDLRVETAFDNATQEYMLIINRPLRDQEIERFRDSEAFGQRLETLEHELAHARWKPAGPPLILHEGWKVG